MYLSPLGDTGVVGVAVGVTGGLDGAFAGDREGVAAEEDMDAPGEDAVAVNNLLEGDAVPPPPPPRLHY